MKTLFFLAALMISAVSFAGNEEPTPVKVEANDPVIGAAMAAIRNTCPNATGDLQYNVTIVSSCFVDGFITKVNFYKVPNCPPNQPCIQVIETVGSVTLGCNNEVIEVTCGVVAI